MNSTAADQLAHELAELNIKCTLEGMGWLADATGARWRPSLNSKIPDGLPPRGGRYYLFISTDEIAEIHKELLYLDLRGLLHRHPTNPNLFQFS